jgi:ribose-phosphate pyrophosphokinase
MILNIAYPEKSEIPFKISKFPDGQQTLDITNTNGLLDKIVMIKSRLNNFKDLELIICANQSLLNLGVGRVHLYVPYFVGARSDRKFQNGGVNYLKQIICPIINSQNFFSVTVLDPHSDVLEACLKNFNKVDNIKLVGYALESLNGRSAQTAIVSPDAGALKKIYDVAKHFNITNVTTASKVRDIVSGNIVRTELPTMDLTDIEHILIIDDICDGGRTFIELAKEIKKQTDKPIYLIVTHGIFSAGFDSLVGNIENIYTTNSVRDIEPGVDCPAIEGVSYVKQLNVF